MAKFQKLFSYCVCTLLCCAALALPAYAGETSMLGEHRTVSAGLAVTEQGEVWQWAPTEADAANFVPFKIQGLANIVEVSGDGNLGAAIDADGNLYTWGHSEYGQLGLGKIEDQSTPAKVEGISHVTSVSISSQGITACAATEDGSFYVWGKVYDGELIKSGSTTGPIWRTYRTPHKVLPFTDAATVSCADDFFALITKAGDLYIGDLGASMVSYGDPYDLYTYTEYFYSEDGDYIAVSCDKRSICAIRKNGSLYGWETRSAKYGGRMGTKSLGVLLHNVINACAAPGDKASGLAFTEDGQAWAWSEGAVENIVPPTQPLSCFALNENLSGAVGANGILCTWSGTQLNPNFVSSLKGISVPQKVDTTPFYPYASQLPAGYLASRRTIAPGFLVKENGDLYRWVMEDDRETRYLEKIEGISNVVDISAAYGYGSHLPVRIAAVTADGSLYTWGSGSSYEEEKPLLHPQSENIPVKSELTDVVSVHLGAYGGGAALTAQGEMYIWGSLYIGDDKKNNYQALYRDIKTPEKVEGLSDLIDVSCDGATYAAVTRSGDLYLWGLETRMEGDYVILPNNTTKPHKIAENIRQVELTRGQSFAVTQDGRVYQWSADPAQMLLLDMPPVKSLSCGEMFYYAAVTQDGQLYMWGDSRTEYHDEEGNFSSHVPIPIEYEGKKTAQVSLGWGYTQVVDEEGKLYLSGRHASGSYVAPYHPGPDVDSRKIPLYHSSGVRVPGKVTGSMEKLQAGSGKVYQAGQFSDVDEGKWYGVQNQGTVRDAYQLGLMDGMGDGTFAPEEGLRISEALKLACALRAAYTGDQIPAAAKGKSWYAPYVHYAVSNGMMEIGEFEDYAAYATRAQMAYLFAAALPEDCLTLSDQAALPGDVTDSHRYARQIRLLYQAGVLQGEDSSGAFHGDSGITRAQAAAIISRLAANGQSA